MPLVKKPVLTEEKLAANRRNGGQSQGAVTEEGKARIAAAQFRHGRYSKGEETALCGLGEDPAEFEELLAGLREEFTPAGVLQEKLVTRLARVLALVDRYDRQLEGDALRRARIAGNGRDNRVHARMMRLKMTAETLRSLARSVATWHYVTPLEDLEVMKKLHQEGVASEMGEIALNLFYQLQKLGTDEDGEDPDKKNLRVFNSIRSIFGLGEIDRPVAVLTPAGETLVVRPEGYQEASPDGEEDEDSDKDDRYPSITAEDWKARERARKLLRNILTRQVEVCETERKVLLRESLAGPSPYELAAENLPSLTDALLLRRVQDANLREVRRLTNLLLKIQCRKGQLPQTGEGGHDILEKEGT